MLFGARISKAPGSAGYRNIPTEVVGPTLPVFSYDTPAAEVHAIERARLSRLGKTPPFADGQIAAIARVNGLILVTRNVADFRAFEALDVENWGR